MGDDIMRPSRPRKKKRRSVTLWFNALAAMSFAAEAKLDLLQPLLPVNVYAVLAFVLIVGNAGLRVFFTSQPLQPFATFRRLL